MHPQWFDELAGLDLASLTASELAKLINSAPHPFAQGMVQAWLTLRPFAAAHSHPCLPQDNEEAHGLSLARTLINDAFAATQAIGSNWVAQVDAVGLDTCTRTQLMALLDSAPNDFAQGLVYGKHVARLVLSQFMGPWI